MDPHLLTLPAVATLAALAAAATGIALGRTRTARLLIPLSGVFLVLVAIFGLIPELVNEIGWERVLPLVAFGCGLLMALQHFAFPVCPSCDHRGAQAMVASLLSATAIHAFVDGWGLVAVQVATPRAEKVIAVAILLHKIPEGMALGTIVAALMGSAGVALAWCAAVELSTLAGGAAGLWLTPAEWVAYPLSIAAGTFLFLGIQAMRTRLAPRLAHELDPRD